MRRNQLRACILWDLALVLALAYVLDFAVAIAYAALAVPALPSPQREPQDAL